MDSNIKCKVIAALNDGDDLEALQKLFGEVIPSIRSEHEVLQAEMSLIKRALGPECDKSDSEKVAFIKAVLHMEE